MQEVSEERFKGKNELVKSNTNVKGITLKFINTDPNKT